MYPQKVEISANITPGQSSTDRRVFYDGEDAISVIVNIASSGFSKEEVKKSLNEVFQKLLECY